MRTSRIIFLLGAFVCTTFTLTYISSASSGVAPKPDRVHALLFNSPLTLFLPNAVISLTDDNTTSFLARPAAFGPQLPSRGLSGELWIGSGFGDDSLRQGAVVAGSEGELGCSDVPGWADGRKIFAPAAGDGRPAANAKHDFAAGPPNDDDGDVDDDGRGDSGNARSLGGRAAGPRPRGSGHSSPSADDGTDDYLHHPLPGSTVTKPPRPGRETHDLSPSSLTDHADIQSLQEAAEIAGKIVMLSRGGCGFLEKVKWTQRRGGIALIVGDDVRGGPLLQMYARGDTSNVTIPSVFTSRTTAHLLSSLVPPGTYVEESIDASGKVSAKIRRPSKKPKHGRRPTRHGSGAKAGVDPVGRPAKNKVTSGHEKAAAASASSTTKKKKKNEGRSWIGLLFSKWGSASDDGPAPGDGSTDWILVEEYDERYDDARGSAKPKSAKPKSAGSRLSQGGASGTRLEHEDGFVIGVQDWRDPYAVDSDDARNPAGPESKAKGGNRAVGGPNAAEGTFSFSSSSSDGSRHPARPNLKSKGGGTTAEYDGSASEANANVKQGPWDGSSDGADSGLLSKLFGDDEDESNVNLDHEDHDDEVDAAEDGGDEDSHDGLWVTLTPTTGASPFFDTLLVLVVSPLVTLSVVYTLLFLRSRIRRRRWRAPKSVVARLPVRTYQSIASTSRLPSPNSSSQTTPLLQQQQTVSRPRPRSRTTTGIPEPSSNARIINAEPSLVPRMASRGSEHEKGAGVASEWKKYMGRQVECVVCLEEYVDGISQVMSLPCGHEFHVECITPWLTTRRRTCPICKGDVVRSLARGSGSAVRWDTDHDGDEAQYEESDTTGDSETGILVISPESDGLGDRSDGSDVERGVFSTPSSS